MSEYYILEHYKVEIGKQGGVKVYRKDGKNLLRVYGRGEQTNKHVNIMDNSYRISDIKAFCLGECSTLTPLSDSEVGALFSKEKDFIQSCISHDVEYIKSLPVTDRDHYNNEVREVFSKCGSIRVVYTDKVYRKTTNGLLSCVMGITAYDGSRIVGSKSLYYKVEDEFHVSDLSAVSDCELEQIYNLIREELESRIV